QECAWFGDRLDLSALDGRVDDHNLQEALRLLARGANRHHATKAMARQVDFVEAQLVHEPIQHIDIFRYRERALMAVRLAEPPEVQGIRPVAIGGVLHRWQPVAPGAKPAMQKDDRLATSADDLVMD